jgi:hypothetical protein
MQVCDFFLYETFWELLRCSCFRRLWKHIRDSTAVWSESVRAHDTAHCRHVLTFLTNLRVSMVHEHLLTCNTTLTAVNFLPKSTKCVSIVISCIDRQLLTKYFLFLLHNKMLTSQAGQHELPVPAANFFFRMELPYLSRPVKYCYSNIVLW